MWKVFLLFSLSVVPFCILRAEPPGLHRAAAHAGAGARKAPNPSLAAYQRQLSNAVGRRWYYAMKAHAGEIAPGSVKVGFHLLPSGTIKGVKVIAGLKEHHPLAELCVAALLDTRFPPMPTTVRAALPKDSMEIDFTFTNKK